MTVGTIPTCTGMTVSVTWYGEANRFMPADTQMYDCTFKHKKTYKWMVSTLWLYLIIMNIKNKTTEIISVCKYLVLFALSKPLNTLYILLYLSCWNTYFVHVLQQQTWLYFTTWHQKMSIEIYWHKHIFWQYNISLRFTRNDLIQQVGGNKEWPTLSYVPRLLAQTKRVYITWTIREQRQEFAYTQQTNKSQLSWALCKVMYLHILWPGSREPNVSRPWNVSHPGSFTGPL